MYITRATIYFDSEDMEKMLSPFFDSLLRLRAEWADANYPETGLTICIPLEGARIYGMKITTEAKTLGVVKDG